MAIFFSNDPNRALKFMNILCMLQATHTYKQFIGSEKEPQRAFGVQVLDIRKKILKAVWTRSYVCLRSEMLSYSI